MTKWLIFLGVCALATGAGVRVSQPGLSSHAKAFAPTFTPAATGAKNRARISGRARWQAVWTRPAPRLQCASLAPNGTSVAWVDDKGAIRRVLSDGRTLWQTGPFPGVNRVAVSESGIVLAYGQWNPAFPSVRLFDPKVGENRAILASFDGAIWDVALSPGGSHALISTGRASLNTVPIAVDKVQAGLPTTLPGIAESVAVAQVPSKGLPAPTAPAVSKAESLATGARSALGQAVIALGTWQESGVGVWDSDRTPKRQHRERLASRAYDVQLSKDGATLVAVSGEGPARKQAKLHVWDTQTGKLLWAEDLQGYGAKAAVSANGNAIAVTFAQTSQYRTGTREERRVVLYDRLGRRLFEPKGGHFFAPDLVALSPDGKTITVSDTDGTLWSLDDRGTTVARLRPPQTAPVQSDGATPTPVPAPDAHEIKQSVVTPSGKFLLVYRGDGNLTLYKATKP